jgi:hypothetical protein
LTVFIMLFILLSQRESHEDAGSLERYLTSNLGQRGPTPQRVLYLFFSFRIILSPRARAPGTHGLDVDIESGQFCDEGLLA